jgi:hypothetical protein
MFKTITSIILSTLFFFGCESSTYKSKPTDASSSLSGIVVDGYINGATLCLDKNLDKVCDATISKVTSNKDGVFNFSNVDLNETAFLTVIATGGIDTSTQKNFTHQLKHIIDTSKGETEIVVSPLTDLVAVSFLTSDGNDSLALSDATSVVSQAIGLSETELYTNPMKNIKVFSKSQELQHTKYLIQTAFEKRSSIDKSIVEEKIKEELINHGLNISQTLIAMEINLHSDLPENEKTFIQEQIIELKRVLNSLTQDTSLELENLNRLKSL